MYRFETKCIQSGYEPENGQPRTLPIYQSTTYKYDDAAALGKLFDLEADGHMYTRISNPTVAAVEAKIADLEGGVGAMLTSSGQAASFMAVFNICSQGQNFISMNNIYGGTINLFSVTLARMGIEVRYARDDMTDEEMESLFDENTRLVFGETVANPALTVLDIERMADLAHRHGVPLIVDNTFTTPYLCNPFKFGADIVTHSTSKYMDGHANVLGGCIVDGGTFDWEKGGKFPELSEADESYHGVVYTKQFGKAAFITKARVQLMRDFGCTPQPMAAYLLNLGLETMALRVQRHSENALKVAQYLQQQEKVLWVNYPLLEGSKYYDLAVKYLPKGASGVVSFGVKGGREAAMALMNKLRLAQIVVHVADARTCVLHPASTTHRQLTDAQLEASGIGPEFIRFSVGIENVEDIIADLQQALDQI
ncbi:MAG: O-acetylhomoserine aminocarboxypropyltransferase/cysteine synthase [Oscillospiraceae bacterium]|nr:O-acetylhomoserine aminocarboxypropyltransferase/cysteine synthase [Oscillospiraceae bacterium]